jgi:hypothetical protein
MTDIAKCTNAFPLEALKNVDQNIRKLQRTQEHAVLIPFVLVDPDMHWVAFRLGQAKISAQESGTVAHLQWL